MHLVEYLYQGGIERLLEQMARHTPTDRAALVFFSYQTPTVQGIGKELQRLGLPLYCYDKPMSKRKLTTIYNGVDIEAYKNVAGQSDKSKLRLVNISRISPEKNLMHLLRACEQLNRTGIPFELQSTPTRSHLAEATSNQSPKIPIRVPSRAHACPTQLHVMDHRPRVTHRAGDQSHCRGKSCSYSNRTRR